MIKMYTVLGKAYSSIVCLKSEVRLSVKSVISQPAHSCLTCVDDPHSVELEQDMVQIRIQSGSDRPCGFRK